ncbi:MAG: 3-oxoadipate enol-lactonase [Geodermatophilaceae bacterium]|nr:3-oxoadipate enol-lactonase [Geodermatophilaceae bacterium]
MTVALYTEVEGPPGAPWLVLLNSLGTSTRMWDAPAGPLAEQFRVVRVDARGHGRSPASPDGTTLTVADLGTDLLAALDRLGVDRAHVAGVSLGGMTAMWLAAHHPDRVARLALVCSSVQPGNPQTWRERAATVRAKGMTAVADTVVDRWLTAELIGRAPQAREELRAQLVSTDPESYAQCCEALQSLDLTADLARIAAPTLVIAGRQDQALPPAHSERIAAGLADARLQTLSPAAHIAPVEQAGAVTALLRGHFGGGATLGAGFATRRAVLGEAHVDRSLAATTALTAPFQEFLTRYAWGDVWSRPGLSRRDRSITTLAALVTLGAEHEIGIHVRAAVRNGLTPAEIGEVLLHTALYAGLPRANRAFAIAQETLAPETLALDKPPE